MSKYRFRLETLRRLRIAHRDQQRAALADAYRAEELLAERRAALADERDTVRNLHRSAMNEPYLDVNRLVDAERYQLVLEAREKQLTDQANRLAIEVERRRLLAVEADRAVRVLDRLDERHRRAHRRDADRRQVKELDEVAATRYVR